MPSPRTFHLLPVLVVAAVVAPVTGGAGPDDARTPQHAGVIDDGAGLRSLAAAQASRPRAPRFPRAAFIARQRVRTTRLSPDGASVVALIEEGGLRGVWLATAAEPGGRRLLERTPAEELEWSRDGRWLFLVSPDQVFALAMAGQGGSRAFAALGGRGRREFAAVDPWRPASIVLLERPRPASAGAGRWRLWRATPGAPNELLHESEREITDFALAPDGRLTHLVLAVADGHDLLRHDGTRAWKTLVQCRRVETCDLLGTAADGQQAWMVTNHGGDLLRLVEVGPDGTLRTVHSDPEGKADLAAVVLPPGDERPRIAAYASIVARSHGLDPEAAAGVERLEARFPGRRLDLELGRGSGARWLVHERGGALHGRRLHLVDPRTGAAVEVFPDLEFEHEGKPIAGLPEAQLAHPVPVSWQASDGMRLQGFLLLPPGVEAARAPLMVHVHGGPWNHVGPDWSLQAQFLANRGYIVFSPNFRGSTGHGRRYLFAARGDFGGPGRVQQDIVEGTRWLLAHGIGDPQRVGMIGASYGGYASLLGLSFTPELFRVGIAAVPPTDLGHLVRENARSTMEFVKGVPLAVSMRDLGLDPADAATMERLSAQSPLARADAVRAPVLIYAGGEDDRISLRSVTHYAARLQLLAKDVSLFVDADAGHSTTDRRTGAAALYLEELLLHRVLGGASPEPADAALRAHLERNLRLTGRSLQRPFDGAAPVR